MDGIFHNAEEKSEAYNTAHEILSTVQDEKLRAEMTDVFGQLRKINRHWFKLVEQAEKLQQERYERALIRAATEFTNRGVVNVEKNTLIALAKLLMDFKVV